MASHRRSSVPAALFGCALPLACALSLASALGAPARAQQIGRAYCPSAPNATGAPSTLTAEGSTDVTLDDVLLRCAGLPPSARGYFLVSRDAASVPNAGGGLGTLCLGGTLGRYSHSVLDAGAAGEATFRIDLRAIAQPAQPFAVLPGDTLRFQLWHRDALPGGSATSNTSHGLELTFGCGESALPRPVLTPEASRLIGFDVTDLDGDGALDLVDGDGFQVSYGRADRRFDAPVSLAPGQPLRFDARDLDADGRLDLVGSGEEGAGLTVVWNLGPRVYSAPLVLLAGRTANVIGALDLDADGLLDLVAYEPGAAQLHAFLGDGQQGFTIGAGFSVTVDARAFTVGDFDGDGYGDVLLGQFGTTGLLGDVVFLPGDGAGGFSQGPRSLGIQWGIRGDMLPSDRDGDGVLDLLPAGAQGRRFLMLGNGDGTFQAPTLIPGSVGGGGATIPSVLQDVDGDAVEEIVDSGGLVTPGLPGGGFGASLFLDLDVQSPRGQVRFGDLDGDAVPDAFVRTPDGITFVPARGGFLFERDTTLSSSPTHTVADFDGDGRLDLLGIDAATGRLVVRLGDGVGGFGASLPGPAITQNPHQPRPVVADFDGDGIDDVALLGNPLQLDLYRGAGGGALAFSPASLSVSDALAFDAGDVDGDLRADLILAKPTQLRLVLRRSLGLGVFGSPEFVPLGSAPLDVELIDLDADGDLDLAVATGNAATGALILLTNDGAGGFTLAATIAVAPEPNTAHVADLDGDGHLDAVLASAGSSAGSLVWGPLLGGASVATLDLGAPGAAEFAAADIDGDAVLDLLVARSSGALSFLRGLGGRGFAPPSFHALPGAPQTGTVSIVDVDGDGDVDLIVGSERLTLLENRCR